MKVRRLAFDLIGYGGFPSNHTAIISSVAAMILFTEGPASPAFGVAVAITFIVMLDASSLRKQVGLQAGRINQLSPQEGKPLRERMGHTPWELLGGVLTGVLSAAAMYWLFNLG